MFTPNLSPKQLYPSYYLFKYKHSKSFILSVLISESSSIVVRCMKDSSKSFKEIEIFKSAHNIAQHKQIHFFEFASSVKPVLKEISKLIQVKGPYSCLQERLNIHRIYSNGLLSLNHSSIKLSYGELSSPLDFYNDRSETNLKNLSIALNKQPIEMIDDKLHEQHFHRIYESLVKHFNSPEIISIKPL